MLPTRSPRPAFADLTGLPPLYLEVGGAERLVDDATLLVARARSCGVDASLQVVGGGIHAFPFASPEPTEVAASIARIGRHTVTAFTGHDQPAPGEQRMTTQPAHRKFFFDDVFTDLSFLHTLTHHGFGGAALGECYAAAATITPGDAQSWRTSWLAVAERAEADAVAAEKKGHLVSARGCYLRAVTYYWNASMGVRHTDPGFRAAIEKYRSLFIRFGELSTPTIEYVQIPFGYATLPAFFMPADADGQPRPTIVIGDNVSEELYYWVGPPATERGYNALLVDLPGIGLNWMNGVYFRPDTEVGVGAAIDYLLSRADVDPDGVVVYGGGEPGGYTMARATAHEPRIAACVLDPYVPDNRSIHEIAGRDDWANQSAAGDTVGAILTGQLQQFYTPAPGTRPEIHSCDSELITAPLLCLNDSSDSAELIDGAQRTVGSSSNPSSTHRVFTPPDGTSSYRELDNFALKHRAMFDWLDEIFDRTTPPTSV